MSSVPFLSGLASLATSSDGPSAEASRATSSGASSGPSRGGPGLTLGPVLGVTATISAQGLQALSDHTLADTVGDVAGTVGQVLGNVVAYGVMAALGGGAVLDELV